MTWHVTRDFAMLRTPVGEKAVSRGGTGEAAKLRRILLGFGVLRIERERAFSGSASQSLIFPVVSPKKRKIVMREGGTVLPDGSVLKADIKGAIPRGRNTQPRPSCSGKYAPGPDKTIEQVIFHFNAGDR